MLCENSIDKTSNHTQKHLRLQKLNNIKKMDKQIRKNWGEMFRHKKILINQNPEQQITKIRHLTTETTQLRVHKSHSNHRHIQKLKSQLKRQQTHERQKKNEEIFFKKRTYDIKNGLARSISTEKSICRFKTEQKQQKSKFSTQKALGNQQKRKLLFDIPFMLKKRTEKIQKQLNRIQSNYQKNLLRIKSKQDLKTAQAIYSQKKMIKKIKGTKIFYQMIREWKPSDQYLQK